MSRRLVAAVLFLGVFRLFCRMACPTVSFDDTGEFCAGALELGVLHPPGYPGYALLLALAGHMPAGSIAFRMNLVGAALGAVAAVALLAWWRRALPGAGGGHDLAGTAVALAAVCATGFVSQATTAKGGVYMANACLAFAVILPAWAPAFGAGEAVLTGGALGLFLSHHWMSAAGAAAGAALVLARKGGAGRARRIVLAAVGAVLGISLYLALPLATVHKPFLNWGSPDRVGRFWFCVARSQYTGSLAAEEAREPFPARIRALAGAARGAGPLAALAFLGAAGAGALLAARPVPALATLAGPAALGASLLIYGPLRAGAPWYLEIFAIPAVTMLVALAGSALLLALRALGALLRIPGGANAAWPPAALALAVATLLGSRAPSRFTALDRSREYLTWDLAENLMASAPGPGLLFAGSDAVVFGNWHAWRVERRLRGPVVVPAPLLPMPWVAVGFADKLHGLRAPYPADRAGEEAVPALLRAWEEGNAGVLPAFAFLTDTTRAAWGGGRGPRGPLPDRLDAYGWFYRVRPAPGRRPAPVRPPALRAFRWRGILAAGLDAEPRRRATLQPIWFTGAVTLGSWLAGQPGRGRATADVLRIADALARSPGDRGAVAEERGQIAARARRFPDAEARFAEAVQLDPGRLAARRNLAMVQMARGRMGEAAATVKTLIRLAPGSPEARELAPLLPRLEHRAEKGR